jgi:uncharacterized coiled-coil DUF342 family protein
LKLDSFLAITAERDWLIEEVAALKEEKNSLQNDLNDVKQELDKMKNSAFLWPLIDLVDVQNELTKQIG